jgi:competence protein ComEA
MPTQPPFVLPPDSWRTRLAGLLAGAGRQGAAVAVIALVALAGAGAMWVRATARPAGPFAGTGGPGPGLAGPAEHAGPTGPAGGTLPSVAPGAGLGAGPAGSGSGSTGGAAAYGAGPAGAGTVTVDVVGRVRRAGVVRLPAGSRVIDAVQAAGGAAPGADLAAVNLARKVVDGEQVRIPAPGDPPPPAATAGGTGTATPPSPAGPVDLNTATVEQLDALPGVGEVTANRIIAYRTAHPFRSVEELRQVDGIGDRRFATLKDLVTVG